VSEPSYGELADLVAAQARIIEAQAAEIRRLTGRVAELEARLARNSSNSSKPPSSDGLAKPEPKSLRRRTGRRPGGQAGHQGRALRQVADPDEVVRHEPAGCRCCGRSLAGRPVRFVERRQQFDIPPISVRVTEHQLIERQCRCGAATRAQAPAGVGAPVQYGPRIAALVVYLYVGQFLSKQRTAQALAELFGTPISAGTVAALTARAAGGLDDFLADVRERLVDSPVVGFDETGLRVEGKLHWVHCARTEQFTLLVCHPRRGRAGIEALGVLPRFAGVAIHDAWAPYETYPDVQHQLCCAHVQRELQAVADATPAGAWCWAEQAADALVTMQRLVGEAIESGRQTLQAAALATEVSRYRSAAQIGINSTTARSDPLMKKHNALARRLINRQDDYLRFSTDWQVTADNNGSERDIRMIKLRQKVSGCLRTLTGATQFCAIRSYLATAAKHSMHFFDALVMLTEGHPWIPAPA